MVTVDNESLDGIEVFIKSQACLSHLFFFFAFKPNQTYVICHLTGKSFDNIMYPPYYRLKSMHLSDFYQHPYLDATFIWDTSHHCMNSVVKDAQVRVYHHAHTYSKWR